MEKRTVRRMRGSIVKGVAWLAVGAVAILAVELAWDHVVTGGDEERLGEREAGGAEAGDDMPIREGFSAFVFDGDDAAIGLDGAPPGFAEECFDAHGLGEVRSSHDGGVVGIISDLDAGSLFRACADRLAARGWVQMESGSPLRCTFVKDRGAIRWVYLDVTEVSGDGVAVLVIEGGDDEQ